MRKIGLAIAALALFVWTGAQAQQAQTPRKGGTIRMTDIEATHRYTLTVSGEGQQSIIGGTAVLNLSYNAETGKTTINWVADANISGKLASVAQRLVSAAASLLGRQFFQGIAKQLPS